MSTYQQVQDRINQDYLNRTDFTNETQRAIQAAIRHYERKHWEFNETQTSVTTSSGQKFVAFPSNLLLLDDLRITLSSADYKLVRRDPDWIREANTVRSTGQPTDYAIYQNRVELFAIPDSAYSLPIYYVKQLAALSAGTDTNSWTTGPMEDVIVYHATKLMWANVLRNEKEAAKFAALEQSSILNVSSYNEQFRFHALKPTQF